MCFGCWGGEMSEEELTAAVAAGNMTRAMQLGGARIDAEVTDVGITLGIDRAVAANENTNKESHERLQQKLDKIFEAKVSPR